MLVEIQRTTRETEIELGLEWAAGERRIDTGIPFFDHMIDSLSCHAGLTITLRAVGDLAVDDHHTVEDVALVLGQGLRQLYESHEGQPNRFGAGFAPLDEALARVVVDFVTRPCAVVALELVRESLGGVASENFTHFFRSLAMAGRFTLHVDVLKGENDHHKVEAAFKALALALRESFSIAGELTDPSTKGVL